MNTKTNITGLAATIASAILAIWVGPTVDPSTPNATKIAQSLIVACALALSVSRMDQVRHIFLASFTVVGAVLTFVGMKLTPGSAAAGLIPVALAVLTNINTAFAQQEKMASVAVGAISTDAKRVILPCPTCGLVDNPSCPSRPFHTKEAPTKPNGDRQ
jgi:hypothetical protein